MDYHLKDNPLLTAAFVRRCRGDGIGEVRRALRWRTVVKSIHMAGPVTFLSGLLAFPFPLWPSPPCVFSSAWDHGSRESLTLCLRLITYMFYAWVDTYVCPCVCVCPIYARKCACLCVYPPSPFCVCVCMLVFICMCVLECIHLLQIWHSETGDRCGLKQGTIKWCAFGHSIHLAIRKILNIYIKNIKFLAV